VRRVLVAFKQQIIYLQARSAVPLALLALRFGSFRRGSSERCRVGVRDSSRSSVWVGERLFISAAWLVAHTLGNRTNKKTITNKTTNKTTNKNSRRLRPVWGISDRKLGTLPALGWPAKHKNSSSQSGVPLAAAAWQRWADCGCCIK